MQIRLATLEDVPALVAHEIEHMAEPAFGGKPAHPFPLDHVWDEARKLYTSMGFKEILVYEDRIRVNGQSIDDVSMTLWLNKNQPQS